jgi:hypothetical protein
VDDLGDFAGQQNERPLGADHPHREVVLVQDQNLGVQPVARVHRQCTAHQGGCQVFVGFIPVGLIAVRHGLVVPRLAIVMVEPFIHGSDTRSRRTDPFREDGSVTPDGICS